MTQAEKRLWLIEYLLGENERYKDVLIPADSGEQFNLYRSLVNVRMPAPISEEYLNIEDEFLKEETAQKGVTLINAISFKNDIAIWQGDITTLKCDAIVNAANSQMLGCFHPLHNCIDNCIHTYSGLQQRNACYELMQKQGYEEPTGQAKITPAFNLPCRYVIHTVGPIVNVSLTEEHRKLLKSCYLSCLKCAEENRLKSIAFCCIATGVFGFPKKEAAKIAVDTVKEYKKHSDIKVIFNVFTDDDLNIYKKILGNK